MIWVLPNRRCHRRTKTSTNKLLYAVLIIAILFAAVSLWWNDKYVEFQRASQHEQTAKYYNSIFLYSKNATKKINYKNKNNANNITHVQSPLVQTKSKQNSSNSTNIRSIHMEAVKQKKKRKKKRPYPYNNQHVFLRQNNNHTPDYHLIFSTGCSEQQDWESYVFFYHAWKVKQPGTVSRIASGCTKREQTSLEKIHERYIKTMSSNFSIFFTRDYSGDVQPGTSYKYYNKPNGVYEWMKQVLQKHETNKHDDDIIMLLDPDMILLQPLSHDFGHENVLYATVKVNHTRRPLNTFVTHGHPMAQQDGYLVNQFRSFNYSYITGGGYTFPSDITHWIATMHYRAGPPYLATVKDMFEIVQLWKVYVPRIYEEFPELFAEMYGYILACVRLNLPHTLVQSMVSSTTTGDILREGWPYIDVLSDNEICVPTSVRQADMAKNLVHVPPVIHYCKRYLLGKWFFSKYRLKKKYISCDTPLLTMPPSDVGSTLSYYIRPPPDFGTFHEMEIKNISKIQSRREAYMLCAVISGVNDAARHFKMTHCKNPNMNETYNFHDDPFSM